MLQPRMSPFDIDVLAIPTSLAIIILFELSGIVPIMLLTCIIPSPAQVIIFADAGVTAKAARAAEIMRYFIVELSLDNRLICRPSKVRSGRRYVSLNRAIAEERPRQAGICENG